MLDKFFKPKGTKIKSKYTLEQLMKLDLITKAFKDLDDTKLYDELVKIVGNSKMTKKEADDIILDFLQILKESPDFVQKFEHNGVWYGFVPNLDKMSVGEYIDLDTYMKQGTDQAHRLMAILYRPITSEIGDLYQIEEYEGSDKYCKVMLTTPYHIYLSAMVFFYGLTNSLKNYLNTSTLLMKKKESQQTDTQA